MLGAAARVRAMLVKQKIICIALSMLALAVLCIIEGPERWEGVL